MGCSSGDEPFIMSQMHAVVDSGDATAGYSCAKLGQGSGSSSGGSDVDDFWMREDTTSEGLSARIGSYGEVLEQRFYGRDFAARHGLDRFVVTTQSGARYSFVYWGGDECERCPPGPYDPLPGDPWGCGSADAGAPAP